MYVIQALFCYLRANFLALWAYICHLMLKKTLLIKCCYQIVLLQVPIVSPQENKLC